MDPLSRQSFNLFFHDNQIEVLRFYHYTNFFARGIALTASQTKSFLINFDNKYTLSQRIVRGCNNGMKLDGDLFTAD